MNLLGCFVHAAAYVNSGRSKASAVVLSLSICGTLATEFEFTRNLFILKL